MNRTHWKHLEAAAKSIGSALNLEVKVLAEGEDYPILELGGVSIRWEGGATSSWIVEEAKHISATRYELADVDIIELGTYLPSHWPKALARAFQRLTEQIIEAIVEAEALAEQLEDDELKVHLRKVE